MRSNGYRIILESMKDILLNISIYYITGHVPVSHDLYFLLLKRQRILNGEDVILPIFR